MSGAETGRESETSQDAKAAGATETAGTAGADRAAEAGEAGVGEAGVGEAGTGPLAKAVRAAETALIEFEIAVETFRVEVENFSRIHHQRLGPVYARLDELDAQIAEARAARSGDPEDIRRADEARAAVLPMPGVEPLFNGWIDSDGLSPEGVAMLSDQPVRPPARVRPDAETRAAYRDLVRRVHPDLARDDADRERREAFMVRVNRAYAAGNPAELAELAEEWDRPRDAAEDAHGRPSPAEELVARLEWLAERKELLVRIVTELEESAIGAMLRLAPDDPDVLLEEIAGQLAGQVAERERELAELRIAPADGDGGAGDAGDTDEGEGEVRA